VVPQVRGDGVSPRLAGRVAVVTGAGRGIGRAVARRLVDHGAVVVALNRSPSVEPAGWAELACDVSSERSVEEAVGTVLTRHQRIDILVNNAGITHAAMVQRDDIGAWEHVLHTNLLGPLLCTRAVLGPMRAAGSGAIVNVSSMAARLGNAGQGAYSASKAGVEAFTRTTAREGARHGIRANAVRPGFIETDMTGALDAVARERFLETVPMGRPGRPEEVADAVVFLASDWSSYLTGTVLDVAGGRGM